MVRLVFRPYTQIRRTICTSVSLRASTRVSPGFTLFRHSSPSFGSQHICSYSDQWQATAGRWCRMLKNNSFPPFHFHSASGFDTQTLAHMLDSLVRVSRRVDENHFASNKSPTRHTPSPNWLGLLPRRKSALTQPSQPIGKPKATLRFDHARVRRTDLELTQQCYFPSLPP